MSLDWEVAGAGWPNRAASRFLRAGGLSWHVQVAGDGPVLLLLHGTGASSHSWRALLPLLATDFTVVAPDLPGHGFTQRPVGAALSLPAMARHVAALLDVLGLPPEVAVGHSAGAAIALRLSLDERIGSRRLVSINGAIRPLPLPQSQLFPAAARLLLGIPAVPALFAWRATDRRVVERLMRNTGSTLDAEGERLYRLLARDAGHVGAALAMMAHWDLRPLGEALGRVAPPVLLVAGLADRMIPPADAQWAAARLPEARVALLPGLGHLAHEERPGTVARLVRDFAAAAPGSLVA